MSYRYGPLEQPRLMLGLRPGQALLAAIFAPLTIGSFFATEALRMGMAGVIPPVLLLALGAGVIFVPVPAVHRGLDEIGPDLTKHLWRRLTGRDMWLTGAYRKGQELGIHLGRSVYLTDFVSRPPFLEHIDLLAAHDDTLIGWGVAHDTVADHYIAVLPCLGPGTALMDPEEVSERQQAYAEIIASYGQREQLGICAIGWTERIVPDQGEDVIRHMLSRFDNHEAESSRVPFGAARTDYRKLVSDVGPISQQHELFLELVLDGKVAALQMQRMGNGNREVGAALLLRQEAEELRRQLEAAEITAGTLLTPRELAFAIRVAFMPEVRQTRSLMERHGAEKGVAVENAWPSFTRARMTHLESDGWYHRSFFVKAWPQTPVGPEYLWPLLRGTRSMRSLSVTMEPILLSQSMGEWSKRAIDLKAHLDRKQRIGQQITPDDDAAQRAHEELGEQLADGFVQMRFQGFVTVSAPSLEELEAECAKVTTAAGQARLQLEVMLWQQEVGMRATLPLGRGR